ncbi:MAG: restriction endonuclease subunit S [Oscillospiraceae bacterium]|nr:restriction endonuclease subunit S [Oscillospiraceae bacterium]
MTPQELKNSILQLAIQGKLVEQRPEEGTAEELYKQIQKEPINTDKNQIQIFEGLLPFEIPNSWIWVRLKNISQASMANIIVPLPPLAEQKRIVARLEELLPLCERLR